ncbi:DUF3352 domain-containing protein [Tumidithrix elongata RA019]|uniref:DUF3352 domain-containing protein n=1 Tax=Tumidithrix elongata BACA0141 TaxID=2716417 RepID=A0AAW9PUB4_9CYAN|nr:DUF3352 domain-containing protein [Tumidithrix elongata RA019]
MVNLFNLALLAFLGVGFSSSVGQPRNAVPAPHTASAVTVQSTVPAKPSRSAVNASLTPEVLANQFSPIAQTASEQEPLAAAKILPSDLLSIAVLNVNPQLWDEADRFNPFGIKALEAIAKLNQLPKGMTFKQDIQPWLGDRIVIAVSQAPNKKDFELMVLMPITNGAKYEAFIAKAIANHKQKPNASEYKGVRILEWEADDPSHITALKTCSKKPLKQFLNKLTHNQNLKCEQDIDDNEEDNGFPDSLKLDIFGFSENGAVLATFPNGYLVVSGSRQPIEKLIDAQANLIPLTENPLFQRTVKNPLWQRSLLAGYGDNKLILQMVEANLIKPSKPEVESKPKAEIEPPNPFGYSEEDLLRGLRRSADEYASFDLYTWVSPQGLHSQSNTYYTKPHTLKPAIGKSDRILSLLPANSYVSISSQNFTHQWQWLKEEIKWQPSFGFLYASMRQALTATFGVDIDRDIAPWIDGEYAMVLFPSDRGLFKAFDINLAVGSVIQTSNPSAANAAIAKIEKQILSLADGTLSVSKRQVGGVQVTSWEVNDPEHKAASQSVFAYGWKDKHTLVLATGIAPISTLIVPSSSSLAQSEMFKVAIANMPKPNFGYFFVNTQGVARLVVLGFASLSETFSESQVPPQVTKILDTLGGMVIAYSQTPEKLQSDSFLGLNPVKK